MTDVHRRFLQLLMTHGVLEEWDVRRLQKHCYRVHDREYRLPAHECPRAVRSGTRRPSGTPHLRSLAPARVLFLISSSTLSFLFFYVKLTVSPGDGNLDFEPK